MIELFVFDLGNVILPFNHRQIVPKLIERSRSRGRHREQEIFDYIFDYDRGLINPYEEGLSSSLEFFLHIRERYDLLLEFEEFAEIWNNIFWDDPEVNEIIVYLKARGVPVYLLSNTNELHFCHILRKFPIVHLMDEWILSFEVGAKKPHRRMFEAVFERSDVRRESVLCIDDIDIFVAAAKESGMQGLLFREAGDLWKAVKDNFEL